MGATAAFILGVFVVISGKGQGPDSHYYLTVYKESISSGSVIGRTNRSESLPRLVKAILNDGYGAYGKAMIKASLANDLRIQAEKTAEIQSRITDHLDGIAARSR